MKKSQGGDKISDDSLSVKAKLTLSSRIEK